MDCRCSFKAFGVILLHFKVDKMNRGHLKKKLIEWGTHSGKPRIAEIAGKTLISGYSRKILIPGAFQ
jgi:hypothetical protein